MKKIYVLGEDKELHEIDAGVSQYAELVDAPFKTTYNDILLVGSTITEEEGKMVITKDEEHLWSEDEITIFCSYAESGRYDICTDNYGTEILIVDKTNSNLGNRYRRITPDQDMVYDKDSGWIAITDTSAKELVFKLQNEDDFINATSVVGNKVTMECYFFSTLGSGNITVTKEGKVVASSILPIGKITSLNLTNYITDGENQFYYTVTNSKNKEVNGSLSVTGIEITYKPTFNVLSLQRESEGNVNFSFTYNGTGNKYVHFDITNADGETYSFNSTEVYKNGGNATYSIPTVELNENGEIERRIFSQGANTISTYMFMKVGNTDDVLTKTDLQTYTFPFIEEGREAEYIVMTYYDFAAIQEWATIAIPYRIWCGVNSPVDSVKFELEYEQEGKTKVRQQEYTAEDKGAEESYLSVNTEHFWQLSGIPHGTLEFRIYIGAKNEEGNIIYGEPNYIMSNVEVAESDYNFNTISGYLFNFAANDIEDTKAFDSWMSESTSMQLNGFNWITDGITTETDGKCLKFSPLAKTSISGLKLFSYALPADRNTVATSGLTLEFDFKVNENANNSDPIIRFYNSKNPDSVYGVTIYPTKAVFNYDPNGKDEQITIDFQKGERKNIAMVIEPSGALNSSFLIRIYLDGIISKCIQYANNTTSGDCDRIEFNVSSNEFFLYSVRAYASVLSSQNMLQNYISNFADIDTKTELLLNNKIYDETRDVLTYTPKGATAPIDLSGEYPVSLKACIGKIPCLVIYTPDGALPETKAAVNCYTLFYEKDDDNPQTEWKNGRSMATTYYYNDEGELAAKPITVGGQGTSSLEYPRKNFKFKFKNKFYIKGHENGRDKTITVKVDYMDSSGVNNMSNAQICNDAIIANEWLNSDGSSMPVNDGYRLNLDGFPCLVFWANKINDDKELVREWDDGKITEPEFYGIGNFNYDKKPKALLGWNEDTFQGFEFRDNTSSTCLQKGIPNMTTFKNANVGFEWRWTYISDYIDDYYDGNLTSLMDGAYVDEDIRVYTEQEHINGRWDSESFYLKPYNYFYVEKDGEKRRLYHKMEDGSYDPISYDSWLPVYRKLDVFELEYGVRISTNEYDGKHYLQYQLPYGNKYSETDGSTISMGSLYEGVEGYYKFEWRPDHTAQFKYNSEYDYFKNDENWTRYCPIDEVYSYADKLIEDENGEYVYDNADKEYHPLAYYTKYKLEGEEYIEDEAGDLIRVGETEYVAFAALPKYRNDGTYEVISANDEILTWDFMQEIFKNWYYCIDALSHCTDANFKDIIDSTRETTENGKGLFCYNALLQYYCISLITGLCDNFAKNMFMHSYDEGQSWSPAWYDMDTAYGLDNSGAYRFNYDVDFTDPGVFNGSNSTLWDKLYRLCMSDIRSKFYALRNGHISYDQIMKVIYNDNIEKKTAAMYNASANFRYIIPYLESMAGTQLPAAQGDRLSLMKYWHGNRQSFLDSVYGTADYKNDIISMRMMGPKPVTFNLTPDINMVVGVAFNVQDASYPQYNSGKLKANNTWSYTITSESYPFQDLNTYLFGASHLADIGDISLATPRNISFLQAYKLKRIILGSDDPEVLARYDAAGNQTPLVTMPIAVCDNLIEVDFHNLKNIYFTSGGTTLSFISLNGGLVTNLAPSLQRVDTRGSGIAAISLGDYTPVEYIGYSDEVSAISLRNLPQLSTVEFGAIEQVQNIEIENCDNLDQLKLLKLFQNKSGVNSITCDNLLNDEEGAVTTAFMDWLYNVGSTDLKGEIYVQSIADSELDKYRKKWTNLTIKLYQIFSDDVIFGVTGEGE